MKVDDTLAAIDAAIGCAQCGGNLRGSPSADFCSETCQARWLRNRTARPNDVLGSEHAPHRGTGVTAGREQPQEAALPEVRGCGHCDQPVRWMKTRRSRIKVNAWPDPERGNLRWLASERVCVQFNAQAAEHTRRQGFPLFVFHGLDCEATREMSSRPRPRQQRTAPPASPATQTRVMGQLAEQLGWRPGGSWRIRRGR